MEIDLDPKRIASAALPRATWPRTSVRVLLPAVRAGRSMVDAAAYGEKITEA